MDRAKKDCLERVAGDTPAGKHCALFEREARDSLVFLQLVSQMQKANVSKSRDQEATRLRIAMKRKQTGDPLLPYAAPPIAGSRP
jgi:hypothetical protein